MTGRKAAGKQRNSKSSFTGQTRLIAHRVKWSDDLPLSLSEVEAARHRVAGFKLQPDPHLVGLLKDDWHACQKGRLAIAESPELPAGKWFAVNTEPT